jgi:hypothetical protein
MTPYSSNFIAWIHFCLGKRTGLRLIAKPYICSFCITHSIFTSSLCFHLSLIQPSTYTLIMCECEHGLDASSMHLTRCLFGGQWITTHDAIINIMYVLIRKNGHNVWRKRWSAFTSKASLWAGFYMTHKDQVFVVDVVVTNQHEKQWLWMSLVNK